MLRLSVYADKHHQSFAPINIIHNVEMRLGSLGVSRCSFLVYHPRFEHAVRDNDVYGIARFLGVFDTDRSSDESNCCQETLEAAHFDFDPLVTNSTDEDETVTDELAVICDGLARDEWKKVRTLLNPAFSTAKLRLMMQTINKCADVFVDILTESSQKGDVLEMYKVAQGLSLDVITKCALAWQELTDMFPDNQELSSDDLRKLKRLDIVLKESLRLYPPTVAFVSRTCRRDITVMGQFIPSGREQDLELSGTSW
ncbi:hypothetical protein HPB47_018878 [Ixodes persulcatus]|uniref:Uncharacterized protein n=1 Tax=Ixodes persulcatus TaxID=34615 RepID=A0AC60QM58_IXOPE|nr:hypothetical protein HPB47_018878 [Ixodes persulcatus]